MVMIQPSPGDARLAVNDGLVSARTKCQQLIGQMCWLRDHYKVDWSYSELYTIQQRIDADIKTLWETPVGDVGKEYNHTAYRRVMD